MIMKQKFFTPDLGEKSLPHGLISAPQAPFDTPTSQAVGSWVARRPGLQQQAVINGASAHWGSKEGEHNC